MPTSILEELITEQLAAQDAMSRAFTNLKKKGAPTLVQPESADPQPPDEKRTGVSAHTVYGSPHRSILLATARVIIISELQRSFEARALVDPCSEATFISESLAQRLRLQRQSMLVPVSGIGGARCSTAKSQASIIISPYFKTSTQWKLKALILPHLSDYIPPSYTLVKNLSFVADLLLADKDIDSNDKVDLIIGADLYPALIEEGLRKCDNAELIAQSTALGWILTGATPSQCSHTVVPQVITSHQISIDQDLHDLMERFWTQEEIVVKSKALTTEEEECEAHFASTHRRDSQGRYILRLPFKSSVDKLGDSASIARKTLIRTEKRFSHQPQLHKLYSDFMQEYIVLDHMSETDARKLDSSEQLFFLPHHGVLKVTADKSKLRFVFNGSIKTNSGVTLNDRLHIGPKLQNEIFDILLRWRTYRYVFSADIEKMFRQILIDERDRRYQQIFWRNNPKDDIKAYSLHTVTYGLASSPYQAIRVLHQLAADEKEKYPTATQILLQNSYVDDILAGAESLEEAQNLRQELSSLLLTGGFPLSKWTSNHPSVLSSLSPAQVASSQQYNWPTEESYCMLGITWQPNKDCFKFSVKNIQIESIMTKHKALSFIGFLYDPLGWISPIIIQFKIFIQRLWPLGLTWDDPLPQNLHSHWQTLVTDLQQLSSLSVPRWFGASLHSNMQIEVHGFADASQAAYGAVVYLRLIGVSSSSRCIILASKTKVAPLKQVSLPRLELCAAHLLTRLVKHITNVISSPDILIHLWSDSTIVLSWIHGHPTQWKTYVANRVSEIQTTLPSASWHHIAGTQNPADVASRGASVEAISSPSLWMDGPKLLATSREPWTREINIKIQEVDLESRTIVSHATSLVPEESAILLRYSPLNKLLRVTARCVEFGRRLRDKTSRASLKVQTRDSIDGINELTPAQIDSALDSHVKQLHFSLEIRAISQNSPLSKRSGLVRLTPFIDEQGLLRVGGRLQHSLLHPHEKHPYILPHKSFLSLLLARDAHSKCLHDGTQLTLSHLRRRFCILRGRQLVKGVIFRCIRCWRYQSTPTTLLMSDLPQLRVQRCRPFLHTGIDYAEPIYLKCSKGRGTKSFKGYIAIFVCLPTRAIHLEVASGYSTEDFLLVYRRFVARRGICATLSSDCGTNFVGADKELRELFAQAKSQHSEIAHHLANEGTEWRFNPPSAPHFGGIWEAAVKSTKFHLRRVIGESRLTFEELSTLLAQIEACLNSRPLQPLTDDPTDLAALTPAHFLIGSSTCTIPEPSTLDLPTSRLSRAQLLRNMYEHFCSCWSAEYLQELQYRP